MTKRNVLFAAYVMLSLAWFVVGFGSIILCTEFIQQTYMSQSLFGKIVLAWLAACAIVIVLLSWTMNVGHKLIRCWHLKV
jgi:hypothetical protein